jgi:hypothetical protein
VILEHDNEHVIEPRDTVSMTLTILILGPHSRHTYRERQNSCQSKQISSHSHRSTPPFEAFDHRTPE